jgi:allantoate deiminase
MMKTSIQVNEQEIDNWLKWLSEYGQSEDGGVTRLLYDESWAEAQSALKVRMEQIGLSAQFDGVGNLFGKLEGTDKSAKPILTGSHIDTVVNMMADLELSQVAWRLAILLVNTDTR